MRKKNIETTFYFRILFWHFFTLCRNTKYTGHGIYKSCRIIYDHNTLSCLMLIWKTLLVNRRRKKSNVLYLWILFFALIRFAGSWAGKRLNMCVSYLHWFLSWDYYRQIEILFRMQRRLPAFEWLVWSKLGWNCSFFLFRKRLKWCGHIESHQYLDRLFNWFVISTPCDVAMHNRFKKLTASRCIM